MQQRIYAEARAAKVDCLARARTFLREFKEAEDEQLQRGMQALRAPSLNSPSEQAGILGLSPRTAPATADQPIADIVVHRDTVPIE